MRQILTLIIFIAVFFDVQGQNILVRLYGADSCKKGVKQLMYFGLVKKGIAYSVVDSSGVLVLSEAGNYSLSYVLDDIDATQLGQIYSIDKAERVFSDTLKLFMISPCLEPTSHPDFIGYCCCNQKCEGDQVEYYSNGNKRIEGCFKEGLPQGNLKFYYPSGQIKQVDEYNKKGYLKRRILYNENGKVKRSETY